MTVIFTACAASSLISVAPSGPVRNLVATTEPTASHTAAINVSWVPPVLDDRNGVLTGYRVTYYPTDGTAPSNVLYVSYDDLNSNDGQERERSVLITHLDGHRPYDVIVSACIDVEDGKPCGPETAVFVHTLETSTMRVYLSRMLRVYYASRFYSTRGWSRHSRYHRIIAIHGARQLDCTH